MKSSRSPLGLGVAAVAVALCLLGVASCKPVPYYLAQVCKVHGTVSVEGTNGATPIGSVEVFVGDYQYSELTNYYGDYELELPQGTWTIDFRKEGFQPASGVATVSPDAPRFRLDMEMVPLPPEGGTVEVVLTEASVAEGERVLVAVYPAGTDTTVDPIGDMVGTADFDVVGGSGGQLLEVPWSEILGEIWYGSEGESYDLYLWVDMNGNLQDGVWYPEPGIDMQLSTYPLVITIEGNLVLSFTGGDLVVTPSAVLEDGTITVLLSGATEHNGEKFMIAVFAAGERDWTLVLGWDANEIVGGVASNTALACSPEGDCAQAIYTGGGSYDVIALIFAGEEPVSGEPYAEVNGLVVDGDMVVELLFPEDFREP